jgi:hypothetical protein
MADQGYVDASLVHCLKLLPEIEHFCPQTDRRYIVIMDNMPLSFLPHLGRVRILGQDIEE